MILRMDYSHLQQIDITIELIITQTFWACSSRRFSSAKNTELILPRKPSCSLALEPYVTRYSTRSPPRSSGFSHSRLVLVRTA